MSNQELFEMAKKERNNAYSPYSNFTVGAVLVASDGTIFTGSNIENSSYGATCCAERVAVFKAIHNGYRKFKTIAIAGGKKNENEVLCPPCGICRQVMIEFCDKDFSILYSDGNGGFIQTTLEQLMPSSFSNVAMQ